MSDRFTAIRYSQLENFESPRNLRESGVRADERFLRDVVGVALADDPDGDRIDEVGVAGHELAVGRVVAGEAPRDKLLVTGRTAEGPAWIRHQPSPVERSGAAAPGARPRSTHDGIRTGGESKGVSALTGPETRAPGADVI